MKKIAHNHHEGWYKGVRFTVTKVEGKPNWYYLVDAKGAHDWYNTKGQATEAAKNWIDFIQNN